MLAPVNRSTVGGLTWVWWRQTVGIQARMPKIVDRDRYRKELLDKAFDVFAAKGYGATTMQVLAKGIGVSTGTLYHYFGSKQELFEQLVAEVASQDIVAATADIATRLTLKERVKGVFEFLAANEEFYLKQCLLYVSFCHQQDLADSSTRIALKHSYDRYHQAILDSIQVSDRRLAEYLLCIMDGLIVQRLYHPDIISFDEQIPLVIQLLETYEAQQQTK
ncbi:MAG: TetR/AcrR family transcriptional regulator [Cyanobacteria bacterium P01_G01_bin.4]